MDEPRPVKASRLPNSHAEVEAIRCYFQTSKILKHEKATRSAVLQAMPDSQVVHFSCQGRADRAILRIEANDDNDEILTVKDRFELHLKGARLATLSACGTGVVGTKIVDECNF